MQEARLTIGKEEWLQGTKLIMEPEEVEWLQRKMQREYQEDLERKVKETEARDQKEKEEMKQKEMKHREENNKKQKNGLRRRNERVIK